MEIQSVKNYRKNLIELEEKQKKDQEKSDSKAKQNFIAFIQASKDKELNASMDKLEANKNIVGSLYSIENNIQNAKQRA